MAKLVCRRTTTEDSGNRKKCVRIEFNWIPSVLDSKSKSILWFVCVWELTWHLLNCIIQSKELEMELEKFQHLWITTIRPSNSTFNIRHFHETKHSAMSWFTCHATHHRHTSHNRTESGWCTLVVVLLVYKWHDVCCCVVRVSVILKWICKL